MEAVDRFIFLNVLFQKLGRGKNYDSAEFSKREKVDVFLNVPVSQMENGELPSLLQGREARTSAHVPLLRCGW